MANFFWNGLDYGPITEIGYTTADKYYRGGKYATNEPPIALTSQEWNGGQTSGAESFANNYLNPNIWQSRTNVCMTSPGQKAAPGNYERSISHPLGGMYDSNGSYLHFNFWRTKYDMVFLYNYQRFVSSAHTTYTGGNYLNSTGNIPESYSAGGDVVRNHIKQHLNPVFSGGKGNSNPFNFIGENVPWFKTSFNVAECFSTITDMPTARHLGTPFQWIPPWEGNQNGNWPDLNDNDLNLWEPIDIYWIGMTTGHTGLANQGPAPEDGYAIVEDYADNMNSYLYNLNNYTFNGNLNDQDEVDVWGATSNASYETFFNEYANIPLIEPMYEFTPPPSVQFDDCFHQHPMEQSMLSGHFYSDTAVVDGISGEGTSTQIRLPLGVREGMNQVGTPGQIFPQQYNPFGSEDGNHMAPNGWLPLDDHSAIGQGISYNVNGLLNQLNNIEDPNIKESLICQHLIKYYNKNWLDLGQKEIRFTVDEFFIQDFDLLGLYQYDSSTGLPTNHADVWPELYDYYLQLLTNPASYGISSINTWLKIKVMFNRFKMLTANAANNVSNVWPEESPLQQSFNYENITSMNPAWADDPDTNIWNVSYALRFLASPPSLVQEKGSWVPLGPPAPQGYQPKCGTNHQAYFGLTNGSSDGATTTNIGGLPFYFQNGIGFNTENQDTLLGSGAVFDWETYDEGLNEDIQEIISTWQQFQDPNASNVLQASYNYIDKELWKYLWKVHNAVTVFVELIYANDEQTMRFTPNQIPTSMVLNNSALTNNEKDLIMFAKKLDSGMASSYVSYMTFITETVHTFNPFIAGNSSSDFGTMAYLINLGMLDNVRVKLLQLNIAQGGIAQWEFNNFIMWLVTNGTVLLPPGGVGGNLPEPPIIDSDFTNLYDTQDLGTFLNEPFSEGQLLNPGDNSITYYGQQFSPGEAGQWDACAYLNQEFPNGNIIAIFKVGANVTNTFPTFDNYDEAYIYTAVPFVQPDGTVQTLAGWYPSDYVNGISSTQGNSPNIFQNSPNHQSQIIVRVIESQPPFYTTAFGLSPETNWPPYYFQPGTTLYDMIIQLKASGYDGPSLDRYPSVPAGGGNESGDGIINSLDGLQIYEEVGDYRPYQFIKWCELSNLVNVIYDYFPINPNNTGENVYPGQFGIPGIPQLFYTSPNAIETFHPAAKQVIEHINFTGPFSGREGLGGSYYSGSRDGQETNIFDDHEVPAENVLPSDMFNSKLHQEGNQYGGGRQFLLGNQIFTQSLHNSNNAYGYTIMDGDPDLPESKPMFTISYGNLEGSGSLKQSNSASPTTAIYKQFASMLRNTTESGSFYTLSGSLMFPGYEHGTYNPVDFIGPDPDIFILSANKNVVQDGLSNNFAIKLQGKGSDNTADTLHLKSDYDYNPAGVIENGSGLLRYNIMSGSYGTNRAGNLDTMHNNFLPPTQRRYGHYYPEVGIWVFNSAVGNAFFGGIHGNGRTDTNVVAFNDTNKRNNGLQAHNTKSDKDYANALKLVNCLRNRDGKIAIQIKSKKEENTLALIAKVPGNKLNHSLNITRNSLHGEINKFGGTMDFDTTNSPTTYPNQIQLYDASGHLVAIGNLSKAIKKDFRKELIIKIVIPLS